MRLLKLCDKEVQQMVIDDMISTGHARALLGITDEEKQYTLAQKIFDEKISVRDTEKLVKEMQKQKNAPAKEVDRKRKTGCCLPGSRRKNENNTWNKGYH